ncbi:MAG: glycosyltransferase family 4 protein [Patescibacteria group bacterium]|jgi:phosphatidylinositol alpha-1,6-mannosyltransferase
MKKTLLVTIDFLPSTGGVANYLEQLCVRLPYQDLVVLASRVNKNEDNKFKFRIYRRNILGRFWPQWLPMIWHIYKIARREKIQMFWAAQPLPVGTAVMIVSKILKIPYIVNTHGMDVANILHHGSIKKSLGVIVLKNANQVTFNSEFTKGLIVRLGVEERKLVKIVPCPVERQETGDRRQEIGFDGNKVLLSVGRLVARKGHDTVIRALPQVLKIVPNLVYLVVGDGENKANLVELIKRLNLGQNVVLAGYIADHDLSTYYRACNAFIMVARGGVGGDFEGFGMVFLEAALFAKPVIAGRSGGQAEAVIDGQTGLVVNPESVEDVAGAILELMTNQELAERLGKQGKERAKRDFSWDIEIKKLEGILK